LRQIAELRGVARQEIRGLADNLANSPPTDESAWYNAVQLDDSQTALLGQYDKLVWERVNWLRDHSGDAAESVTAAVKQLQIAIEQRTDLLIRGSAAPAVHPAVLVNEWMYRSDPLIGLVQQWPDGTVQAYSGSIVKPDDLEIWSAAPAAAGVDQ
jgi:hypothetical protein